MSALSARDGYRLWAPRYNAETAVSHLEEILVTGFNVPTDDRVLLDVGCGTGRRLSHANASVAVGIDLSPEMLARAIGTRTVAAADVLALPLRDGWFDVIWCRLVLGHMRDVAAAYAELSRVCRPGGAVIVTDFHATAIKAGHRRTFRDPSGAIVEVEHHVYVPATHVAAAQAVGLELLAQREGAIGPDVREFFAKVNRLDAYQAQIGLPVVLALSFQKSAA